MNLRPAHYLLLGGSAVIVLFSFFTFYGWDDPDQSAAEFAEQCNALDDFGGLSGDEERALDIACDIAREGGVSAWNTDLYFPLTTWPALLAMLVLAVTAVAVFAHQKLPDAVAGFTPGQMVFGLSIIAVLIMLGFLIQGPEDDFDFGLGFWMMVLGSIAMMIGAAMEAKESTGAAAPPRPSASF